MHISLTMQAADVSPISDILDDVDPQAATTYVKPVLLNFWEESWEEESNYSEETDDADAVCVHSRALGSAPGGLISFVGPDTGLVSAMLRR